jgi:hypothetical protein
VDDKELTAQTAAVSHHKQTSLFNLDTPINSQSAQKPLRCCGGRVLTTHSRCVVHTRADFLYRYEHEEVELLSESDES